MYSGKTQVLIFVSVAEIVLVSFGIGTISKNSSSNYSEPAIIVSEKMIHPEVLFEAESEVEKEVIEVTENKKSDEQVIVEVVMAEAGNQEMIGKVAVAITLLNRIDSTGKDAESIATEAYAYPYYGIITEDCYRAVEIAMNNRDLFPDDMIYFRTSHYHDFGEPYMQIQDHYFSTEE